MIFLIPVDNDQAAFSQQHDFGGYIMTLNFYYNSRYARWFIDMIDQDGNDIVVGRPINVSADLTSRFDDPRLPDGFITSLNFAVPFAEATEDTLGDDVQLIYDDGVE